MAFRDCPLLVDSKILARIGLTCKRITEALLRDSESPGVAAGVSSTLIMSIWLFAYEPNIAYPGGERRIWLLVIMMAVPCLFAWGPIPRNSKTALVVSAIPFLTDISLVTFFKLEDPLFFHLSSTTLIVGIVAGICLGIGHSAVDYDVMRGKRPLKHLLKNVVRSVSLLAACTLAATTFYFIGLASADHCPGYTYFEQRALIAATACNTGGPDGSVDSVAVPENDPSIGSALI